MEDLNVNVIFVKIKNYISLSNVGHPIGVSAFILDESTAHHGITPESPE